MLAPIIPAASKVSVKIGPYQFHGLHHGIGRLAIFACNPIFGLNTKEADWIHIYHSFKKEYPNRPGFLAREVLESVGLGGSRVKKRLSEARF
jgi:hypothetical protein